MSSNANMLTAAKRAAVERNTRIVRQVATVGELDPAIGGLSELVAAALLATAAEMRQKGEDLKAARRKGHVSTKAALDFAAGELGEVAESLALDGVDEALAAIRGASEVAGVGVSIKTDGLLGPDEGDIKLPPPPPDKASGYVEQGLSDRVEILTDGQVLINGLAPLMPVGSSSSGSGAYFCANDHMHPSATDAIDRGCVAPAEAVAALIDGLGPEVWPTLDDWVKAQPMGQPIALVDFWAAMREAWPMCGLDGCPLASHDHPAGVMSCTADRPVGFVDCHCGASGRWPHMIGSAACVNEHPDKLGLSDLMAACKCSRTAREYCASPKCQGGADVPKEITVLVDKQQMMTDAVDALTGVTRDLWHAEHGPSQRTSAEPFAPDLPPKPVPPFADACGALPEDGTVADACVQKAGHAEREWAKDPDAKVRHVSSGGRRIWHVEPAGRIVRDQKEVAPVIPESPTPIFKFAGESSGRATVAGAPSFAMAGAAPTAKVVETFAHPAAPLRLPVLSRQQVMPTRMTWSRIEALADCGMKYRLQNIDTRLPGAFEVVDRPSWALVGGRAFDEMVNEVCAGVPTTYDPGAAFVALLILEIDKQTKTAHEDFNMPVSWNAGSKREDEFWWRREGRRMAQDYYAWHVGRVRDGWALLRGQQDVETELAGKPAFGRLDQLWLSPVGPGQHVEIVDVKSGSSPANPAQLGYYGTLIRRGGMRGFGDLGGLDITLAAYDARKAVIVPHGTMSPALEEIAEFQAAEAWAQLEAQRFPVNTTRGFGGCKSCPVRASCAVGRTR